MSYGTAAWSGMTWSMSSQVVRMLLQLLSTIILSRLLSPEDFGLYAMAFPVIALADLVQNFGLNQALMQKETLASEQLNRVFWINLGCTLGLACVLLVVSPSIASFYNEPRLTPMLMGWSGLLVLGALGFGQYAVLARNLQFKSLALIDGVCAFAQFATAILVASVWPSYWALWLSGFASVLTWVVLTYTLGVWRPGLPRTGVHLDGIFTFGLNVMLSNMANYASRNADTILIGHVFGRAAVGLYDRAYRLLLYPMENLSGPASRVMVPILSRLQNEPIAFKSAFLKSFGLVNLAVMPGMAVAVGCSHELVAIVLGPKWEPITPIFYWLGFAGLVLPILDGSSWVLLAKGHSRSLMLASSASAVVIVGGFFLAIPWGPEGLALSYAIAEGAFRTPLMCIMATRTRAVSLNDMLSLLLPVLLAASVTIAGVPWLRTEGIGGPWLIIISLAGAYTLGIVSLMLVPSGRAVIIAALQAVKSRVRAPRPAVVDV